MVETTTVSDHLRSPYFRPWSTHMSLVNACALDSLCRIREFHLWPANSSTPDHCSLPIYSRPKSKTPLTVYHANRSLEANPFTHSTNTHQHNYEPFKRNKAKVHTNSWCYRGCWHQTGPATRSEHITLQSNWIEKPNTAPLHTIFFTDSLNPGLGQFSRLLLSLEMAAILRRPHQNRTPILCSRNRQASTLH